ncbi:hypothetical protein CCACVL1_12497 [Corchorus capsularis]|uniref:Uncharacterized protein n=1 Tax=Corchorus capsularis TaxID=210143 RepID=A0A1R3IF90_COCAP|nr:hypothetical protein CCACVL1_12497 [Corchorus capsularis]
MAVKLAAEPSAATGKVLINPVTLP